MQNKVLIKEIFESIQGEGLYMGINQLFIRFARCNLNCRYCDTDFKTDLKEYDAEELYKEVKKYNQIRSISLTGGEPLMEAGFLSEFLPVLKAEDKQYNIYLETNGVLYEQLLQIKKYADIIAMDIKLPSCAGNKDLFKTHEKFLQAAEGKELFIKIVFNENITAEEIEKSALLGKKYNAPIILQPEMKGLELSCSADFMHKILKSFSLLQDNVRLIPQVHKFLNAG